LLGRAVVGASLLVACLQAGAASALSFTFSFSGFGTPTSPVTVTGIVDGLIDNTTNQIAGVTVTINSATNGPTGIVFIDANNLGGDGFDVALGQVTGVDISYGISTPSEELRLYLGNQGIFSPQYFSSSGLSYLNNEDDNVNSSNSLVFTPAGPGPAPVPGPLPILGAGAAFGWSRRLRRRIKTPV
jgi:hypothetical protein